MVLKVIKRDSIKAKSIEINDLRISFLLVEFLCSLLKTVEKCVVIIPGQPFLFICLVAMKVAVFC